MKDSKTIQYKEITLEVEYEFEKGRPGMWTLPNGDPGYPDDPDEFGILAINVEGVNIFDLLSEETIKKIDELTYSKL